MSSCSESVEILTWEQYSQAVLETVKYPDDSRLVDPTANLVESTYAVCSKLRKLGQNSQLLPATRQPHLSTSVIKVLGEVMGCCVILHHETPLTEPERLQLVIPPTGLRVPIVSRPESYIRSVLERANDLHRHAVGLACATGQQPVRPPRVYEELFGISQRLPELCFLLHVKPVQVWQYHLTKLRCQAALP